MLSKMSFQDRLQPKKMQQFLNLLHLLTLPMNSCSYLYLPIDALEIYWKSPPFYPVLGEAALKLPSPYSLLYLTSFPSSPREIGAQHGVIVFFLTYKSNLSYTHIPKWTSYQLNLLNHECET